MNFHKALQNANDILIGNIESIDIVVVAHVLAPRGHDNMMQKNCAETEHFTIQEFKEIYQGIVNADFFIRKIFFSELEFIQDIVIDPQKYSKSIVFNLCRNGSGMNKKTLVPAICDLLGVKYTSSGAGQCALARNKWLFTSILQTNNIACPTTGLCIDDLWGRIPDDAKVICKPNCESASQGVEDNSIILLKEAAHQNRNDTLIQEYIDGYECEVPVFSVNNHCWALPPVGISFGSDSTRNILTYTASMNNEYSFYSLSDVLPEEICRSIVMDAEKSFCLLGLQRYGRIDFRIDKNTHRHYVMDISTTPYITHHSSFAYAINQCEGNYEDIYRLILAASFNSQY